MPNLAGRVFFTLRSQLAARPAGFADALSTHSFPMLLPPPAVCSGLGYTIVRPGPLVEEAGGYKALVFDQVGGNGSI